MKIAYLVPYVPTLIRTRSYNLINHLSSKGNEVTVFTLGTNSQLASIDHLRSKGIKVICQTLPAWRSLWNCLVALPTDRPLQSVFSWHPALANELAISFETQKFGQTYDIVHVEHLRGSRYGTYLKSKYSHIPVVWDSVDCISHLFTQASNQSKSMFGKFITRLELARTQKAEGELVTCFDHVLVTSPTDRDALLNLVISETSSPLVSILSNGVDLDYFQRPDGYERDECTLVFSGKMSYHANIAMVNYLIFDIMPRIWEKRPNTRLVVVGKDPPVSVRRMGENPLVVVTGTVDDIRPYLRKATVAVVPLVYGAGIQNKILEAMACNTPVVASTKAVSALNATPGKDLLVANTAEGFSAEVLRLLDDRTLQQEIGLSGLRYVQKHHDWVNIAQQLMDIYQNVTMHN